MARALVAGAPAQDELDRLGLTLADVELPSVEVYPENWLALTVFLALQTQWRTGPAGAVGLDYAVLPLVEQRIGVQRSKRRDVFAALQVLEGEVLTAWRER